MHRIGETFFHVLGGAFADQDYHIPFDFVERVTAEGVYLRVSHGVLRQGSTPWEHPPGDPPLGPASASARAAE